MTYELALLTEQASTAHWGWTIAFFLWFIGLAGMCLFLNFWVRSKLVLVASTVSAIVGTLFVVSHLGRILNLPLALVKSIVTGRFNGGSWMFIGICLLTVLCIACCVQLLLAWKSAEKAEALLNNRALLVFNAALGFAATAYSGFLLTQAEGVALWNTAVLPVLWIASGLSCAVGLVEILESRRRLPHAGWIGTTAVLAHLGEAFILFAFVHVAIATGTSGAVAGAESLVGGENALLFWGGAVGLGLVVPFALGFVRSDAAKLAAGSAAILGALFLRASVLFASVYDPVIF